MKTYYTTQKSRHFRYFYDRNIRCWTVMEVTSRDEDGRQIGDAIHEYNREMCSMCIEYLLQYNYDYKEVV